MEDGADLGDDVAVRVVVRQQAPAAQQVSQAGLMSRSGEAAIGSPAVSDDHARVVGAEQGGGFRVPPPPAGRHRPSSRGWLRPRASAAGPRPASRFRRASPPGCRGSVAGAPRKSVAPAGPPAGRHEPTRSGSPSGRTAGGAASRSCRTTAPSACSLRPPTPPPAARVAPPPRPTHPRS